MSENSKIEWCDHTFNPWEGCTKVSPGCKNCYAETRNARWNGGTSLNWGAGKPRRRTSEANWKLPLKWNRALDETAFKAKCDILLSNGRKIGEETHVYTNSRPRVFCASLADWLDDEVPVQWLSDLLYLIAKCPYLDWLLLTKRPQLFRQRMEAVAALDDAGSQIASRWLEGTPLDNVWIGTTVEDQARADERIPLLLKIPAKVRFLSCEPLLEAVYLEFQCDDPNDDEGVKKIWRNALDPGYGVKPIHWVITGGESSPGCRPFNPDWARSLRDQCEAAGVPFFMKQIGGTRKPFPEIPADLMIREFPTPA